MPSKQHVSVIGVAATYIGTVIGAGYASGQEILQYFLYFKEHTFLIAGIATVFFFIFGYLPVYLAKRLETDDYLLALNPKKNRLIHAFCDACISLSLFGTLVIMLAGAGTTIEEKFHLPMFVGAFGVCVALMVNTYIGLGMVVRVMEVLTPCMFLGVAIVGIYSLLHPSTASEQEMAQASINNSDLIWHWSISGVLYVAFNFQLACAVLVPLGRRAQQRTMFWGVLLGALLLGGAASFICLALKAHILEVGSAKLPMIILANQMSDWVGVFYAVVLFFGLYSTAITCFYGSVARLSRLHILRRYSSLMIISITAIVGFFASLLGFKDLISIVYPLLGYGGVVIMFLIVLAAVQKHA